MWRMPFTIAINLPKLPKILETMHRMTDRPELYTEQERYEEVRYVTRLMRKVGFVKTLAFGEENLPKEGGYLLCPNHQGKYDAYGIVAAHDEPLSIVIDRERSYFMLVNEIVETLRGKRLDTRDARQALTVINAIAKEMAEGRRYILFPEGAYSDSKHHDLWEFKPGCFKAAIKANVPIIPVALIDSYKVYNDWYLLPVKTQVHYLKPLTPDDYRGMTTAEIAEVVKNRIAERIAEVGR